MIALTWVLRSGPDRGCSDRDTFFFNDTATTEIYTLSLHDALPIWFLLKKNVFWGWLCGRVVKFMCSAAAAQGSDPDRKSTRLNSSHANISYAVFCLKKKKNSKAII